MLGLLDFSYRDLPTLNALLNGSSALLLILGFWFIQKRNIEAHYRTMLSALVVSVLFLLSYVSYHTLRQMDEGVGHTRFMLEGTIQTVYYGILISHVILAIVIVPLVLVTVYRGWKAYQAGDEVMAGKHRAIARWTFPIWLYVSITGVIVYLMLYHLPGAQG